MAKKAIRKFKNAFSELLTVKSYDELTVIQISEKANVTRQSFYYHYDSIDDFVIQMLQNTLDDAVYKGKRKSADLIGVFVSILSCCRENKEQILHLYNSTFRERLGAFTEGYLNDLIGEQLQKDAARIDSVIDEKDIQFVAGQYRHLFTQTILDYVLEGGTERPTEIGSSLRSFIGRSSEDVLRSFAGAE